MEELSDVINSGTRVWKEHTSVDSVLSLPLSLWSVKLFHTSDLLNWSQYFGLQGIEIWFILD